MVLNPSIMGKLRQGFMAVAAGLTLAGCSEANAEDNTQAEIQKVAAVVETAKVTRDQCIALATKAEKIACMKTLKAQRVAEITAKSDQRDSNAETISTEGSELENDKEANEQRRTIIKVLNEVRDEGFIENPTR